VVAVIIAEALWRFGTQAFARPNAGVVLPVTAVAAVLVPSDLLVLAVGAVTAALIGMRGRGGGGGLALWLTAPLVTAAAAGAQAVSAGVAHPGAGAVLLYFLRAGVSVFGSGYVLLAYLQRDLVDRLGWMSMDALVQASALAQITPGPLFSTATAAGYAIGGSPGAVAATVGVFAPAFASVLVGAPLRRLLERSPVTRFALDGVVMASVSLLGRALVGFALPLTPWQWSIAAVAAAVLVWYRLAATLLLVTAVTIGAVGAVLPLFRS
jgi:chromate transporter